MALTKISEGGVKDDAASQAKIADEAVDEARLQISNAGTNGQFLSKQTGNTGGLTWADANSYTHPNHSGEVTSTGDGATVIASNIVDEDNLKVSNSPTNGQFLSAQSGNTGGLTWADVTIPPSGNTFTAVANGSIANNKAVRVDTDGKVSEIKSVMGARTTLDVQASPVSINESEKNEYMKVVNCGEDKVLALYQKTSGTFQVSCKVGYHQSGQPYATWGTVAHINDNTGSNRISDGADMVYIGNNRVIIAFRLNGPVKVYMATVNTSNNTVSFSGSATVGSNAAYPCLSYDPDNDSVLCCFSDLGANGRGKGIVITWSGTSLSTNSYVEFPRVSSNMSVSRMTSTYDTNDNRHIVAFNYNDYGNRGYVVPVSVSGTTPTFGSLVQFCGTGTSTDNLNSSNELDMAFDDNVNKFVIFYTAGVRCWKHVGSCSSGTISITPSDQSSSLYTHGSGDIYPSLVFEPIAKVFVAFAVTSAGGNFNRYAQNAFFSLNANGTYATNATGNAVNSATKYTSIAHWGKTDEGRVQMIYQDAQQTSGNERGRGIDGVTTQMNSTLDSASYYVGFADQAYTNGQTAVIKTYGNHVDTLSGLTVGNNYFVKTDGTVATSTDFTSGFLGGTPYAGVAISSSKLIIQHPSIMAGL